MKTFKSEEIRTALQYARGCAREGKPFILSKCGMNYQTAVYFKDAVTHSFNENKHGFNLDQIFRVDSKGNLVEQEFCPRNPKDATIIVRIKEAMAYVSKNNRVVKAHKESMFVLPEAEEPSQEEIDKCINFLKKYGYVVLKKV